MACYAREMKTSTDTQATIVGLTELALAGDGAHDVRDFPDGDIEIPAVIVETVPDKEERNGADGDYITHS